MKVNNIIRKCFGKIYYLIGYVKHRVEMKKKNEINRPTNPKKMGDKILIIGNGPSCNLYFENEKKFLDYDKMVVNYFPQKSEEEFFRMKPKYMCIVDSKLFTEQFKPQKMFDILEKVDWDMFIIYPAEYKLKLKNKNIHYIRISAYEYVCSSNEKYQNKLYMKNQAVPTFNNVINWGVYFSIVFGFRKIGLIGVENSMFQDVYVDKNNSIILKDKHYYGEKKIDYCKEGIFEKGTFYLYMLSHYRNFFAHSILSKLAIENGRDITNYTTNSFIDVYKKEDI